MTKLSDHNLRVLRWVDDGRYALNPPGRDLPNLRELRESGYVEIREHKGHYFWLSTPAGRAALEESK